MKKFLGPFLHVCSYSIASLVTSRKEDAERDNGKTEKGLRHFSAKVCAKVEEKGSTSYNEVADELVQEMGLELGVKGFLIESQLISFV